MEEIIEIFKRKYPPRGDEDKLTYYSSLDIIAMFDDITDIDKEELYQELKEAGYMLDIINNKLVWMTYPDID